MREGGREKKRIKGRRMREKEGEGEEEGEGGRDQRVSLCGVYFLC